MGRANAYPRTKVVKKIGNSDPLKMHHLKNTGAVVTAQYSVNGGGTGREFPHCLIDHEHGYTLKWYETNSSQSWVRIKPAQPINVRAIGFKSANDMPHRDPDRVTVKIESSKE